MIDYNLEKLEYSKILDILQSLCLTDIGKNLASNLRPSNLKEDVLYLINQTDEATSYILKNGVPPISYIPNIDYSINILNSEGSLSAKSLLEIASVLELADNLKEDFFSNDNTFEKLNELYSNLYTNKNIYKSISSAIIDELTIDNNASKQLSNIRRNEQSIEENIKTKLNNFIHSSNYSKYIQENIVTIRNDRYVIPVKEEYRSNIKGFVHDISASGSTVFVEPMSIFDLNNELATLKAEENIEIARILENLSSLLYPIIDELKNDVELIGQIDLIFAKAKYGISLNATKPEITDNPTIKLISARHPFIDKDLVVPIDIEIGFNFKSLVITGPNTGGKTVTLKTVGLITVMACSGLFIPAKEHSKLFVFDNVFADIGDEQSIQESLSTFSAHMVNIIRILNSVTNNSLVLLDELGSGTDPVEGSSLAISILETFHQKDVLTIATTHYSEIKHYALVTDGFENASSDFDVENLKPTYKLLIGIPGKSNAFAISKKLGLDSSIIERAKEFINKEQVNIEDLLKNIYEDKLIIEKEKEQIQKNSSQVEFLRKSLEQDYSKLKEKENAILEKAKNDARNILLDAKEEASFAVSEINKIYDYLDSTSRKSVENIRNSLNESIKKTVTNTSNNPNNQQHLLKEDVSLNMEVFVDFINQYGTVLSLPNKNNEVQVQIGEIKMMLPISQLIKSSSNHTQKLSSTSSYKTNKTKSVSTEINVIGYNVDEAIFVIDKYLDDCYLSHLETVRIVHGKGTGALRNRYS